MLKSQFSVSQLGRGVAGSRATADQEGELGVDILRNSAAASIEIMPVAIISASENVRRAGTRNDRQVPGAAMVDSIACTRVPSGRRASTYGEASSKP